MSSLQIETEINQTSIDKTVKKTSKGKAKTSTKKSEEPVEIIIEESTSLSTSLSKPELVEEPIQISNENEEVDNTSQSEELLNYSCNDYLSKLDQVSDGLSYLNDKYLKDYDITKDFISQVNTKLKKINKFLFNINQTISDHLFKENLSSIKKDTKNSKKPKKQIDKEKCAINIVSDTYPEVLSFMELSDDVSQVSKAQVMQEINSYVKKEKLEKNPDILVEGDNKSFQINGRLSPLFVFIKKQMIERGDLQDESEFPKQLMYTQLMKYLKYCFPVTDKAKK
jgi:hypothetical protein